MLQDTTDDSALTEGLICRNSDYRTLAGDPYYDVTEVKAKVEAKGYFMLQMLKVRPRNNPLAQDLTFIYVLEGW